jgi:hypothetical protein
MDSTRQYYIIGLIIGFALGGIVTSFGYKLQNDKRDREMNNTNYRYTYKVSDSLLVPFRTTIWTQDGKSHTSYMYFIEHRRLEK